MVFKRHLNSRPDSIQEECDFIVKKSFEGLQYTYYRDVVSKSTYIVEWPKIAHAYLFNTFYWTCLANRDKAVSFRFLFYANQVLSNSFRWYLTTAPTMTYYGHQFVVAPRQEVPLVPKHEWLKLIRNIQLAYLLRDTDALSVYALVESPKNFNFLLYTERHLECWTPLLTALCRQEINAIKEALKRAICFEKREIEKYEILDERDLHIDSTTPYSSGYRAAYFEHDKAKYLNLPWLLVIDRIYERDEEDFNNELQMALEKHRYFYEYLEDDFGEQRSKPDGWVSLALTTACVLAKQQGITRTVQSDYTPEWLIEGDFQDLLIDINSPL